MEQLTRKEKLGSRYRGKVELVNGRLRGWVRGAQDVTISMKVTDATGETVFWNGICEELRPGRLKGNKRIGFDFALSGKFLTATEQLRFFDTEEDLELPFSPLDIPYEMREWIEKLNELSHWPFFHLSSVVKDAKRLVANFNLVGDFELDDLPLLVISTADGERYLTRDEIAPVTSQRSNVRFWHARSYPSHKFRIDLSKAFLNPHKDAAGHDFVLLKVYKDGFCRPVTDEAWVAVIDVNDVKIPPDENVRRVQAGGDICQKFTASAYNQFRTYQTVFETYAKRPLRDIDAVLDWGCGCARVTQQFMRALGSERVFGADIDAANIDWCVENFGDSNFVTCDLVPPLPYADNTFDFIVATSVLTHIKEELIVPWLTDLNRVLKKGGIAALTIGGDTRVALGAYSLERIRELESRGIEDHIQNSQLDNSIDDVEYYRNVRMSKSFVRNRWSEAIDVVEIIDHAIGAQDIVVCRGR